MSIKVKFNKVILWSHLVSGIIAGITIFMMSVTGVLLTYEHQLVERADMSLLSSDKIGSTRKPLETIITQATERFGVEEVKLIIRNDISAPYQIFIEGRNAIYVDAYTGEYLGQGAETIRSVFNIIKNWHRWFNLQGDKQIIGKKITGISNVLFLVLLLSGIYVWFPRAKKWLNIKNHFIFDFKPTSSKIRDLNWHNVFGFWSLIPLVIIAATAITISYPSINNVLKKIVNDEVIEDQVINNQLYETEVGVVDDKLEITQLPVNEETEESLDLLSLDELLLNAQTLAEGWQKMSLVSNLDKTETVSITFFLTNGNQPQLQETWYLNPYKGDVINKSTWADKPSSHRMPKLFKSLHTGAYFGLTGQAIAALVCLSACVLVWTGFTLTWRRYIWLNVKTPSQHEIDN